jgi:hypothetical protein
MPASAARAGERIAEAKEERAVSDPTHATQDMNFTTICQSPYFNDPTTQELRR